MDRADVLITPRAGGVVPVWKRRSELDSCATWGRRYPSRLLNEQDVLFTTRAISEGSGTAADSGAAASENTRPASGCGTTNS